MEIDYKGFGMTFTPLLQGHYTFFNQRYSVYEPDLAIGREYMVHTRVLHLFLQ